MRSWSDKEIKKIISLKQKKWPLADIANEFDTTISAVRNAVYKYERSTRIYKLSPKTEVAVVPDKPSSEAKQQIKRLESQLAQLERDLEIARRPKLDLSVLGFKGDKSQGFVRVVVPDTHGCFIEEEVAKAFINDLAMLNPTEVVLLGDHIDCAGFLAQHHGITYINETKYSFEEDVAACNTFFDAVQKAAPKAEYHYLSGNHECIPSNGGEVLTKRGWVVIQDVTLADTVGAMTEDGTFKWVNPSKIHEYDYDGDLITADTRGFSVSVTPNHRIVYRSQSDKYTEKLAGDMVNAGAYDIYANAKCSDTGINFIDSDTHQDTVRVEGRDFRKEHYVGKVHCLTTETGNFFIRRNGKVHLTGNSRIEKWIATSTMRNPRDSAFLYKRFSPESVLSLDARKIPYYRQSVCYMGLAIPGTIKLGACAFTHGSRTGRYSASAMLHDFGGNVVFGHIHSQQQFNTRNVHSGEIGAWSPGTLAKLQPMWMHTQQTNWTHGYGLQLVHPDGTFLHINVPIINFKSQLQPLSDVIGAKRKR